ncbi:hypothetical protein TcWFU_008981 [Taenia crassiceps]|uniref:Uncharacterized protein n=1 Tax=Taenia crassiceps TaxID=6207 RepID=A0ABR4Q834_9CEST
MHLINWICLLISLISLVWSKTNEDEGIVELLQELRKEPPPEPVWMLHEVGSILDDTWDPTAQDNALNFALLSYLNLVLRRIFEKKHPFPEYEDKNQSVGRRHDAIETPVQGQGAEKFSMNSQGHGKIYF